MASAADFPLIYARIKRARALLLGARQMACQHRAPALADVLQVALAELEQVPGLTTRRNPTPPSQETLNDD